MSSLVLVHTLGAKDLKNLLKKPDFRVKARNIHVHKGEHDDYEVSTQSKFIQLYAIEQNISRVIVGKAVRFTFNDRLAAQGHVLLEDVPHGKTTIVRLWLDRSISRSAVFKFTPDVMPSDITGYNMYNQKQVSSNSAGRIYYESADLADEINRTSPKTQSSLLRRCRSNR